MNQKGLTLIELLVAMTLFAIAAPLLYRSFYEGARSIQKVRSSLEEGRRSYRAFSSLEKDLKNSVSYSPAPFQGSKDSFSFVSLDGSLSKVTYELKNGEFLRTESPVAQKDSLAADSRVLMAGVSDFHVEYAYSDENKNIVYRPQWSQKSDNGIPRAMKMTWKLQDAKNIESLFVWIPQGSLGLAGEPR